MIAFIACILAIAIAGGIIIRSAVSKSRITASTSPAPPPLPAPAATASSLKSWSWLWWIPVIAGLVAAGWWAMQNFPTTKAPIQPQVQRHIKKQAFKAPFRFIRGEKIIHSGGIIRILDGGFVNFEVEGLPKRPGIRYRLKFSILRKSDGLHLLWINGKYPIELRHLASTAVENKEFASQHFGEHRFREGRNFFKFSSPGDEIELRSASIEAEWEE